MRPQGLIGIGGAFAKRDGKERRRGDPLTFNVALPARMFQFLRGQHDIPKLCSTLCRNPLQQNGWRLHHIKIPGILLNIGKTVLIRFICLGEQTIGQMILNVRLRPEGEQ